MKTHVLRGSKQEIAERLVQISGEVREAIVFVDEPAQTRPVAASGTPEDIFTEMAAFMVDAQQLDDSREATYTRMAGE